MRTTGYQISHAAPQVNIASRRGTRVEVSGSGAVPRNRFQRAEFVSENPSISAVVSGQAAAHLVWQLRTWRFSTEPVGLHARFGRERVAITVLGQRADVWHQPVCSGNSEFVGDRTIENLPSRFDRHLRILVDGKLPLWICLNMGRKIDHIRANQELFVAGRHQMRNHSRAMARRLNGTYTRQEFWFSLEWSDVFPCRNRSLNALAETFARLSEIDRLRFQLSPPIQSRRGPTDLRIPEDLRIGLIVHAPINVVAVEMGDKDRLDCLGVKTCRRHALEKSAVAVAIDWVSARARIDQDHLIA